MAAKLKAVEVSEEIVVTESAVVDTAADVDDQLESMFAELESELTDDIVIHAEPSEDEMAMAGNAVAVAELRAEAMAELDAQGEPAPDEGVLPSAAKAKRTPPATKRISSMGLSTSEALSRALGSKANDYLTLDVSDLSLSAEQLNDKIHDTYALFDKLPVKIREKVVNVYASLVNGAKLSVFTQMAIDLLISKGTFDTKTLKDAYRARPYSEGTSNSQCAQMMTLLPALGMAKRTGSLLIANDDSTLLPMFESKASEPAAEAEAE